MKTNVLLIDDDDINNHIHKLLTLALIPESQVYQFQKAQEALRYLQKTKTLPNLILLDLQMPFMNGWEFLQALEELDLNVPVFVVTSSMIRSEKERAKSYPCIKEYIVKPLMVKHFKKLIALYKL